MAGNDIKLTAEGYMSAISPQNCSYYEKAELQSHVMGGLRLFPVNDKYIIKNPDGEELGLPYNGLGTCWIIDAGYNDHARGTVLLVCKENIDLTKLFDSVEVAKK